MNGIYLIISKLFPFVPSTDSGQALSLSKDSERLLQDYRARQATKQTLRTRKFYVLTLFVAALVSCRQEMADQPNYRPLVKSDFFADGRSARPAMAGTVARGQLREDEQFYTGRLGGEAAATFPFPVTRETLYHGQQRFDIFCSPCHDRVGNGQGMIVRRGFRSPPSLHIDRLREARPGYFFDVISRGFGTMPDYAEQIPPEDRWAIAAYIRALQLSQQAALTDAPENEQRRLRESEP